MNPNEMTLDQCRKWLYRDIGLTKLTAPQTMEWATQHWDDEFFERCWANPSLFDGVAPATLDWIAAAMPEGWVWQRKRRGDGQLIWVAEKGMKGYGSLEVSVADTGDEKLDRARLAVACRMAERGSR